MRSSGKLIIALLMVMFVFSSTSFALLKKDADGRNQAASFRDDALQIRQLPVDFDSVKSTLPNARAWQSFTQKYPGKWDIYIDKTTGMPAIANGPGVKWANRDASGKFGSDFGQIERSAREFLEQNRSIFLGLPSRYLELNVERSGFFGDENYLAFVDFDVVVNGIPVEGAHVVFRVNHGNLVQFGAEGLNALVLRGLSSKASVSHDQASSIAFAQKGGFDANRDELVQKPSLKFIPDTRKGVNYRLIWELSFRKAGENETWIARIDANSGKVLEFFDGNMYGAVKGGVYEISQTRSTEVRMPMPYVDLRSGTSVSYGDSSGKYTATGSLTTNLNGQYVRIADNCGSISYTGSSPNDFDLGVSAGTDCTTPGVGGAGNTHSARSAFYHVNRIKEKGRAWLPTNTWLGGVLTSNMNINQSCNAFWNGSTINFYRSGGGCGNTGEIAAIFLHEYGHGLDSNDGRAPSDNGTGEAYGDTVAFLETHDSCIGPGFLTSNCGGYGNSCTSCTGVRDVDYAKHSGNTPSTIASFVRNSCPSSASYRGPCGKEGHCESLVLSESLWDIANRDLPSSGFDSATAWYVLDRLFYLSRASSAAGYSCNTTSWTASGCGTNNWHQTFLVVDDDNGNLTDGTPHAAAIKNAFTRHGIACSTATATNSTTCGAITSATPSMTVAAGNNSASLSWGAVSGASSYHILRNDFGCSKGYTKIGQTSSTSFTDTSVANGFTYYYRVVAVGASGSCFSRLSSCQTVTLTGGGTPTYSISGTITSGGTGLGSVTVTLSGAAGGSTTTASNGTYSFAGLNNGSYTVTPSRAGYTFSPSSASATVNSANVSGVNFTGTATSTDTQLTKGVGVASSVTQGNWVYFYIDVPAGASNLVFATSGATGDVDLYTQFNVKPTSSSYVCRPYSSSGNETCTQATPSAGRWYAGVHGYAAGSFTITANYTVTTSDTTAPTTSLTAPASGSTLSGTVTVSANASDNVGVTKVDFYAGATLIGTDTTSPYSVSWNTTSVANGSYTLTSRAFDAAGNSGNSAGVPVTVSNTATCTSTSQLLLNPGFESGNVNWTTTAGVIENGTSKPARTGSWKAYLNGYGTTHTDYAYQQITIPAGACSATLVLYIRIDSAETTTTAVYDRLRVEVLNSSGTVLSTLATYSNLNKNSSYLQKTFSLTAYKGQTIRVRFYGTEDSSLATHFLIDDTAVNVTQ